MAVYLGGPALDQIDAAQATVDKHVARAATGLCGTCRVEPPCRPLTEAVATLIGYGRLPRRRPGASLSTRRDDSFAWLSR